MPGVGLCGWSRQLQEGGDREGDPGQSGKSHCMGARGGDSNGYLGIGKSQHGSRTQPDVVDNPVHSVKSEISRPFVLFVGKNVELTFETAEI